MGEEALNKSGTELFKELLRIYETAEPEDYQKLGHWKDDLLKMDLVLVEAHRKEAGAPDPPDLADVIMPDMGSALPALASVGAMRIGVPGVQATVGGPVAELRLIALFVAKWKLDPTKTKLVLAKLTPQRRRHVMQHFKSTESGDAATAELGTFITECEANGEWDKGVTAVVPATVAKPNFAAMKRPISLVTNPTLVPGMRPRLAVVPPSGGLVQSPAQSLAARLAAARAASPRPALVPRPAGQQAWGQQAWGAPVRPAGIAAKPPAGSMIKNLLGRM